MAEPPVQEREKAACVDGRQPRDGSQAWLGLLITIAAALLAAAALAWAVWRWTR